MSRLRRAVVASSTPASASHPASPMPQLVRSRCWRAAASRSARASFTAFAAPSCVCVRSRWTRECRPREEQSREGHAASG
eukprot:190941-Rhodomonas_salina.1